MKLLGLGLGLALLWPCSRQACAQALLPDTSSTAAWLALRHTYEQALAPSPLLISGPQYVDYSLSYAERLGHPYFLSPERLPGRIDYNGQLFNQLMFRYDVVRDQLVLPQPTSPLQLRLLNEKVRFFVLNGHHFVRLAADSAHRGLPHTGYYELLADGSVQLLARRSKQLQEEVVQHQLQAHFLTRDRLYLGRAGHYTQITSKRTLLRLLADQAPAVQQYTKSQHLKFGRSRLEASTLQLVQFYSRLPPH